MDAGNVKFHRRWIKINSKIINEKIYLKQTRMAPSRRAHHTKTFSEILTFIQHVPNRPMYFPD